MNSPYYQANYKVRIADANAQAQLKIPSLFEMLQEAATEHAQKLGVDFSSLAPQGLGWALSKMSVEILRMPNWNERVHITTWASIRERITTFREFEAKSTSGEMLFTARSQWVLFDLNTRRLTRMERLTDWVRDDTRFANSETFSEHLSKPTSITNEVECHIRNNDIDLNKHVNNSIYIVWAIQPLSDEFLKKNTPSKIKISFLEEIKMGERVKSILQKNDSTTLHSIQNLDTGRECARINIHW